MEKVASNDQLQGLIKEGTVVLDFFAPWCGPCRMMSQVLTSFEKDHPEIKIAQINTDEQPELAAQFNVMAIPTLFVFKDWKQIERLQGYRTGETLAEIVL